MAAVRQAQQDLQTYVENTFLPLGAGYADQYEDAYIYVDSSVRTNICVFSFHYIIYMCPHWYEAPLAFSLRA